jgi:hypothetical protein
MSVALQIDLAELDAGLERSERCIRVCRESPEFADLEEVLRKHLVETALPYFTELLLVSDGALRGAIAERYRRLRQLLL